MSNKQIINETMRKIMTEMCDFTKRLHESVIQIKIIFFLSLNCLHLFFKQKIVVFKQIVVMITDIPLSNQHFPMKSFLVLSLQLLLQLLTFVSLFVMWRVPVQYFMPAQPPNHPISF